MSSMKGTSQTKVLHLLVGLTVGGVEQQLFSILPRMQALGYDSLVCALKGWDRMGEEFQSLGITTRALAGRGKSDVLVLWRLYRVLQLIKPSILQAYTTRANWAGSMMGRLARIPLILLSDREIRTWMQPWHRWLDRQCFRLAQGMVVPSKAIKDFDRDSLGLPKEKIWVIPNGVDVDQFFVSDSKEAIRKEMGLDQRVCLAGYVGRLEEPVKGIGHLLRATALLKSNGETPHLAVIGEGPSEMVLREQVHLLALDDQVQFLGVRRDIHRVMKALDLLVLPSLREGCPNVILEAMAAGVPVVATRVEGILELIQHGKTGWLVSPGEPQALAQGIKFVLMNTELANTMAQKAKDWVLTHRSINMTANALASLYDDLIDSRAISKDGIL